MHLLHLGGVEVGKTTNIKSQIKEKIEKKEKVIVLDFNDEYDDITENTFYLDKLNPVMGQVTLNDAKSINAGYLPDSHCLHKMCDEILRESNSYSKESLIEEAVERLQISWNQAENMYGKILNSKIPLKRNRNHFSVDKAIEDIQDLDVVLIKSKNMHSDHLRACVFILLNKLSQLEERFTIVADELTTLFNQGNLKLFFSVLDFNDFDSILSFNKISNSPKELLNLVDEYLLYRVQNATEAKQLENYGFDNIKELKKLKTGKFLTIKARSLALNQILTK